MTSSRPRTLDQRRPRMSWRGPLSAFAVMGPCAFLVGLLAWCVMHGGAP